MIVSINQNLIKLLLHILVCDQYVKLRTGMGKKTLSNIFKKMHDNFIKYFKYKIV